ncbi:Chitin-binding type-2 domain-containing protein [Caenorhabditis elegans]|uniref:Chitin-binding type-2 domain-containing protein n=1 Tax=Caenorhabditis elegans TaxID=6239 RepID=Q95XH9_CAEEL|nr:Chitin-binding type-2 domain-containing protein [Caenorhabditis elegans]CCD74138.2 Chitin-binding type-2 domain-containing protein [Caenorhabditis elegans]
MAHHCTDFQFKDSNIGFKSIGKRQDTSTKKQPCDPSVNKKCVFEADSSDGTSYCNMDANKKDPRCPGSEPGDNCLKITDKDCHFPLKQEEINQKCQDFKQDHRCPGTIWYCTIAPKHADRNLCNNVNTTHDPEVCYAAGDPACVKPIPPTASYGTDFCKKYTNDCQCYSMRLGFLPIYPNRALCKLHHAEIKKWIWACVVKSGDIGAGCYKDTDHDCNHNTTMTEAEAKYLCIDEFEFRDLRCPRLSGEGCDKPVDADCTTTPEPTTTVTTTFPTTSMKRRPPPPPPPPIHEARPEVGNSNQLRTTAASRKDFEQTSTSAPATSTSSTAGIIGGVAALVVVCALAVLFFFCWRNRKKEKPNVIRKAPLRAPIRPRQSPNPNSKPTTHPSEKSEKGGATSAPPKNTEMREKLLETQANLQKIRAHMKKNALRHKSDTRTSKFKKMGAIFILMEPDILTPPVLPNVALDKVFYDPTYNEMYDIGTDVDDIELDASFMVDPSTITEDEATKNTPS